MPNPKPRSGTRPDDEALRDFSKSLPMALLRAREAIMEEFRPHLRSLEVTEQQWRVLRALRALGECNASKLSLHTCISMPSLSRILSGLKGRGLIERQTSPNDLRSVSIRIAAEGQALLDAGAARSESIYRSFSERLGTRRLEELYVLLDEVVDCLQSPTDNTPP